MEASQNDAPSGMAEEGEAPGQQPDDAADVAREALNIRLDPGLRTRIAQAAGRDRRTISEWVRLNLERVLDATDVR